MDEQSLDILERIHGAYYQLTATEKRVADYVLSQYAQVQFMSITQLADECGTAEATISRFCRNLKLKGFNAFKIELARHCAPRLPEHDTGTLAGRSRELGQLAKDAVDQTIALVQPQQVEQAVCFIEQAGRVMCCGAGGSMLLAQECAHLFSTVTGKVFAVSGAHMQISTAATMARGDVLILFSYSGATTSGLQILEYAKAQGIHTLLITRYPKSPAAKLAELVLCCGSNESPFQFGSTPAKIAQLVVTDVVFQEYCRRNRAECEKNIQRVASALSVVHV